jgi:hypothetical protein
MGEESSTGVLALKAIKNEFEVFNDLEPVYISN